MPKLRGNTVMLIFVYVSVMTACVGALSDLSCCKDYGLKTPDINCLMSWENFLTYAVNTTWKGIYSRQTTGEAYPNPRWKLTTRWDILLDGLIQRQFAVWGSPENVCFVGNKTYGGGSCTGTAKLEGRDDRDGQDDPAWYSINRADRFASSDPNRYLIYSYCFDDDSKCAGYCQKSNITVLIKDRRSDNDNDGYPDGDIILDEIPWCEIEETLNRCFDATMDETIGANYTLLEYTWRGPTECRLEGY